MTDPAPFAFDDDPALPGWKRWQFRDATRFNAFLEPIHVRAEGDRARVRMTPRRAHSNMRDAVHGGALLGSSTSRCSRGAAASACWTRAGR